MSKVETIPCPHCGNPVTWIEAFKWRPFCSERCRMIDLGDWLSEKNAIPTEETPLDQDDSDK
ncbi:MAG TPA: DNA gyrase inhibitor YacG [Gammaproteobacteria bacterium]|jgi:hypothetical protein